MKQILILKQIAHRRSDFSPSSGTGLTTALLGGQQPTTKRKQVQEETYYSILQYPPGTQRAPTLIPYIDTGVFPSEIVSQKPSTSTAVKPKQTVANVPSEPPFLSQLVIPNITDVEIIPKFNTDIKPSEVPIIGPLFRFAITPSPTSGIIFTPTTMQQPSNPPFVPTEPPGPGPKLKFLNQFPGTFPFWMSSPSHPGGGYGGGARYGYRTVKHYLSDNPLADADKAAGALGSSMFFGSQRSPPRPAHRRGK